MRSISRSHTNTRPSAATAMPCGSRNWPGPSPGSPHEHFNCPLGEHVHARIAIAVGDVDVALRADGDVGRTVERWAGVLDLASRLAVIASVGWHVQSAHRHQQAALGGELANRVVAVVGGED